MANKGKRALRATFVAALLSLGACSSYHSWEIDGCRIYGGVRYDCGDTAVQWAPETAPWPTVVAVLSFPISLVVDTACLPFTAIHVLLYGEPEPWNRP